MKAAFVLMIVVVTLTNCGNATEPRAEPRPRTSQFITHTLAETGAVSANGQLFWIDKRHGNSAVYGYNPSTQQEFLVSNEESGSLHSDGVQVTWLIASGSDHKITVQRYDPLSKQQHTIATLPLTTSVGASFEEFPMFAADTNTVYYVTHKGLSEGSLYALDLSTGKEQLIANIDTTTPSPGLVAGTGILIRPEMNYTGIAPYRQALVELHARQVSGTDHVFAVATGCARGYVLSGSKVVWVMGCGWLDTRVFVTDLGSGETKALSAEVRTGGVDMAMNPLISGTLVAWISTPNGTDGPSDKWSIIAYDLDSGIKTIVLSSTDNLYAEAIVGQNAIAYSRPTDQGSDLFLIPIR